MLNKLFILGRPGTGKSTIARYVKAFIKRESWLISPIIISDYGFLHQMMQQDCSCRQDNSRRILPVQNNGFKVRDFSILDTALLLIQQRANTLNSIPPNNTLQAHLPNLAIIEFARGDYIQALQRFEPSFLKDAHFLFLENSIDSCIERVHLRTNNRRYKDDMFVPDEIITGYYGNKITQVTIHDMVEVFPLKEHNIHLMETSGSQKAFLRENIQPFTHNLLKECTHMPFDTLTIDTLSSKSQRRYHSFIPRLSPSPKFKELIAPSYNKQVKRTKDDLKAEPVLALSRIEAKMDYLQQI